MSSSGFDMLSAVAIGAAGVVASAALYALSGSGKAQANAEAVSGKSKNTVKAAPVDAMSVTSSIGEVDGDSKQRKKQRQKLKKQQQKNESASAASTPDTASPALEKKKKKKSKAKKNKAKDSQDSSEDLLSSPAPEEETEDVADDEGDLQFALAMAGNQKNMQAMQKEQKLKQQKELERQNRKKMVEDREKRMLLKKEDEEKEAAAKAEEDADMTKPIETTVIAIKPREVSIILGQGGKVIKQIRTESSAKLDVSKREGEQGPNKDRRLLTIVGTSEEIDTARRLLRAVFKEENEKSNVVEVGDKMAAVIGKGGSVINRIKEETGATLDADRECGTIRVSGEPEQIEAAVIAIKKITAPGDQISMKLNKRQKMLVIGKGGQTIRQIGNATNCQLDVEKAEDGGGMLKIGGDSAQVLEAMTIIQKLFQDASYTVTVPCGDLIGAIIGKGGEVIRKIQEDTQVKLDVEMDKKSVQIIGYEKDVKAAQAKVEAILACPVEVKPGETKVHMDIAQYVSSVIGRGGQKVREIEESSGAVVKVLGTDCIIVGKQKNVEKAKHQIDEIIKKQVEQNQRAEAAKAAVQALSESHTASAAAGAGTISWGSSAWGNDLAHWTASPVAATR